MNQLRPFHLAIPVKDLKQARKFYGEKLQLDEGRSSDHWIDYNFFGHQLVVHIGEVQKVTVNQVDDKVVPVPHFGVILEWDLFDVLSQRIASADIKFIIKPYLRFEDEAGEQKTMFLKDPFGNALEFKSFKNDSEIFKK